MNTKEIIKGNKIIAKFMEYDIKPADDFYSYERAVYKTERFIHQIPVQDLDYHTNWKSVMDVINKIESIKLEIFGITTYPKFTITKNWCGVEDENNQSLFNFVLETTSPKTIEPIWIVILDFIKWYNQLNKN